MQGVKQIKNSSLDPIYVFIKPPSISVLEQRLRGRNTETEESLQLRLTAAKSEIEYGKKRYFQRILFHSWNYQFLCYFSNNCMLNFTPLVYFRI